MSSSNAAHMKYAHAHAAGIASNTKKIHQPIPPYSPNIQSSAIAHGIPKAIAPTPMKLRRSCRYRASRTRRLRCMAP